MSEHDISYHTFDRAQKLEGVLHRVAGVEHVLNQIGPNKAMYLNWMSEGHEVHSIIFNERLLKGMKQVAVTLFQDVAREGEIALARDIVEQHHEERKELLGTLPEPRRLIESALKPPRAT